MVYLNCSDVRHHFVELIVMTKRIIKKEDWGVLDEERIRFKICCQKFIEARC